MANAGPNTNGSQFFICLQDLSGGRLPKLYTLFGQVTTGMDVVDAIAASKRDGRDRPIEPTAMRAVTIAD
jgi:cyclophilin family peptidyl-prolyl cis-trans isomerase